MLFILIPLTNHTTYAQQKLGGRIYDKKNREPLAFVNIVYNSKNLGTTTDLDGYFIIESRDKIEFLRISYLGYSSKTIEKTEIDNTAFVEIFLEQDAYQLQEVAIFPGENPAHRIIQEVINRANSNNPEKMSSFSYVEYSKMIFTVNLDKQIATKAPADTAKAAEDTIKSGLDRMREFFDEQHLFITESITQRRFRLPDNNKEEVIAHRMSGLKNPGFTLLTSQMQSFSFYKDFIRIMDKRYINPISEGSLKRYFFLIEDSMYNERGDTIFIISFRPGKGKKFEGLQGILHINSNNYAIQNVDARPFEPDKTMDIKIQQKYEYIENKQWFPVQLNTEITFNFIQGAADSINMPIVGIGKSYLSDISLNPDFNRKDFNHIEIKINPDAHKKPEDFWNKFRTEALSNKDINTYRVIDSIGKEINLDRIVDIAEIIASGYIPIKFINLDPSKLSWFNEYEGYRLGMGISTNEKFLKFLSIGGYFAYGFRDKAWKYGVHADFLIHRQTGTHLKFGFNQDLRYSDFHYFNKQSNFLSNENLRQFFHAEMDSVAEYYGSIKFNTFRYLNANISLKHSENTIINENRYSFRGSTNKFYKNTEIVISLRYAYKEKFFQTPKGNRLSMGTDYPVLYFNIIRGIPYLGSNLNYTKYEAQIYKKIQTRWYGDTHLTINGAIAQGNLPYSGLYYGEGTYSFLNLDYTFNTMRPHEFISDRFAAIHIKHDFGSLLFKNDKFKPQFAITSSAGWGDSHYTDNTIQTLPKIMNKGYFESGIQINNILKVNFTGIGLGVYYRYGYYSFNKEIDNFAFKLNIGFAL